MHLEKIRFCQEYFAIDTIVLPHFFLIACIGEEEH